MPDNTTNNTNSVGDCTDCPIKADRDPSISENQPLGTEWKNTTTGELFVCTDNTENKNIWVGQLGTVVEPTTANKLDVFGDNSCVALYQFDNNANDTGGVYNGIEKGNVTYKDGKYNKAIFLNGSDAYVDLGNKMSDAYYSFSFWADWNGVNHWERIFDFGEPHGSSWQCLISRDSSTNKLCYRNGNNNIYSDDGCIINNELHFYAVVQDGGDVYFYRDGKLFSEKTTYERPKTHFRSYCYIGKSNWPSDHLYRGVIDQLRIFNRALTDEEVKKLYTE